MMNLYEIVKKVQLNCEKDHESTDFGSWPSVISYMSFGQIIVLIYKMIFREGEY